MAEPEASPGKMTPRFLMLLWSLVATISVVTPFIMVPQSLDVFRTPKDIVFMSLCLVLIVVAASGALLSNEVARLLRIRSPIVFAALAAVVWTGITSMTSLRPGASLWKPVTVFCCAAFAIAVLVTTKGRQLSAIVVVMIPAVVNAAIAIGQSTGLWSPWTVDPRIPLRLRTTGLIGNPNEFGSYLVLPALAAFAAAMAWPHRKWLYALAVILLFGIASAQSVTPVAALVAGLFAIAITGATKSLRYLGLAAVVTLIAMAAVHPASRARFHLLFEKASLGQLPEMTSFRVVPAVTAFRMFLDRPLVGVGPGSFSALYMTYKLGTDEAFPQWIRLSNESFGQVHNDHLQILAETGLPGYGIFVTILVLLAAITFRRREPLDERARFARIFAFPAAIAFATLALAQFPLQLTAPMVPALYLGALCFAWTTPG